MLLISDMIISPAVWMPPMILLLSVGGLRRRAALMMAATLEGRRFSHVGCG
jgi:hypothetical protein